MFRLFTIPVSAGTLLLSLLLIGSLNGHAADAPMWTLDAALRRALTVAPEIREANALVAAREGALKQAGAWPNPSIELRADQKLGLEDGRGGTDLTQVAVSQPVPLTRLGPQRRQAEGQLAAARERLRLARLAREIETARAFHALQFAQERRDLAAQRVRFVAALTPDGLHRGNRVVRYLTPIERARVEILREAADQETASAEGRHSETLAQLRALLGLEPDTDLQTVPLAPAAEPQSLEGLLKGLDAHPALAAASLDIDAARAGVDVAHASRIGDPTIGVFRERDHLGGERRDYNGVMLSVEVPLWNLNSGGVARARAETSQALERRAAQRRDLEARLRQSRLHVGHLVEQSERFRGRLLAPARRMLDLARRGFETGEQNILALVDAYNTYFDAEVRYRELLQETWQEAAEMRFAAGVVLIEPETRP